MPNSHIPCIGDYVRIVCSLLNAFRPVLVKNSESDEVLAKRMLQLAKLPNKLKDKVEKKGWDSRAKAPWKAIDDANLEDFPQLTEAELRDMTMGIYQLKQADSYTDEHTTEAGQYEIMIHKEEDGILKAQIKSRHSSSGSYYLWVEYGPGLKPIKGWYCKCKNGARVVGCCAHIASVLWYLGFYRHQPKSEREQSFKSQYMNSLTDAAQKDWDSSSSGDDESDSSID